MKAALHVCSIVLLLAPTVSAATADISSSLVGTGQGRGSVFLNGRPSAGPILVLGSGDRLETGAEGTALLNISNSDTLLVGENSSLTFVSHPDGVAAGLERGRVLVITRHERLQELRLTHEAVSIRVAPGKLSRYQVTRLSAATYVLAGAGNISIFEEGFRSPTEVPEGMVGMVRPEAGMPELVQAAAAPAQQRPAPADAAGRAGQISVSIPKDYVIRGPQRTEGTRGDEIRWNDSLRTEPRGRVRLTLDGGSILNVGSDSSLQVIEHNAQTQQTSLQMQFGRMRAQVVQLTRPNARFEIRTSTAVAGVLGTDFYLEATPTSTRVIVFQGTVRLTPLLAGAAAAITVAAGQTSTAAAGSVSAPAVASVTQVQAAVTATEASATAAQAAVAGLASTTASRVTVIAAAAAPPAVVAAVTVPQLEQPVVSPTRP